MIRNESYLNCDQVRVVNPFTGQLLITHNGPHDSWGLSALTWAPDGHSIASAGDHIELWRVATRQIYNTFTKNVSPINRLAWSPDGKYIALVNFETQPNTNVTHPGLDSAIALNLWGQGLRALTCAGYVGYTVGKVLLNAWDQFPGAFGIASFRWERT